MAKTLRRHPFERNWRRDLTIVGAISFLLSLVLLLYTFGLTSDFIFRFFNAFLGIFILLAGTALVIIPSVNWVFLKFSGKKPVKRSAPAGPKRNLPRARPRTS